MRSIVRRDSGESYTDYLQRLAEAEGIESPGCSGAAQDGPLPTEEDVQCGVGEPT